MTKWTKSLDGKLRGEIRITHRIGLVEMANALAWIACDESDDELAARARIARANERQIRDAVAAWFNRFGLEGAYFWDEKVSDDFSTSSLFVAAERRIAEVIPVLAGDRETS